MTNGKVSLAALAGLAEEADLLRSVSRAWPQAPHIVVGGGTFEAATRCIPDLLRGQPSHLLSFGYCGGLTDGLKSGDLVIATEALGPQGQGFPCDPIFRQKIVETAESLGLSLHGGAITTPTEVAAEPAAKRRLAETTGAVAVDLESALVGKTAGEAGLPFAVIRAVLDDAQASLPAFAITAVDESNGETRMTKLLLGLLRNPGALPDLLSLARARSAARASLSRLLVRPLAF